MLPIVMIGLLYCVHRGIWACVAPGQGALARIPLLTVQHILLLFCSLLASMDLTTFRFRLDKRMLLVCGVCVLLLGARFFAYNRILSPRMGEIPGYVYFEPNFFEFAYLALLLGAAVAPRRQGRLSSAQAIVLCAGFALMSLMMVLNEILNLHFRDNGELLSALGPAMRIALVAPFVLLGAVVGGMVHPRTRMGMRIIVPIAVSTVMVLWGGFYIAFLGGDMFSYLDAAGLRGALGWVQEWATTYFGYAQMLLFLAGWHLAYLCALRKKVE